MAVTAVGVNDALAVKLYAKRLDAEVLKSTEIADYMGTDENSLWQIKTETQKDAGDQITYGLRMQLSQPGVQGDNTAEGNEEALSLHSDSVLIDQLRFQVESAGEMTEQRVSWSMRDEMLAGLKDLWVDRMAVCAFNQLCGNVAQTDTRFTGNIATVAPDASHHIWSGGGATTDQGLGSSDILELKDIDRCLEKAKTLTPAIRPIMIKGKPHYVLFIHPYQEYNLRQSAAAAGSWYDIQKAALQGGDLTGSMLMKGGLGVYNNCIIRVDNRIPLGCRSDTGAAVASTRRAVFCGAQSLAIAFGKKNGPSKFKWVEKKFDYDNRLGVSAGTIFGTKKIRFNSMDFSTIVVSSYAASH